MNPDGQIRDFVIMPYLVSGASILTLRDRGHGSHICKDSSSIFFAFADIRHTFAMGQPHVLRDHDSKSAFVMSSSCVLHDRGG